MNGTGPSRSVVVLGPLSRRINRYVVRIAGHRRAGPLARIHHVGRHSGRTYVRPVLARRAHGQSLIPLFFGADADWCRNVAAAHGARLETTGAMRDLHNPRVLPAAQVRTSARAAFRGPERALFVLAGIKEYLILDTDAIGT